MGQSSSKQGPRSSSLLHTHTRTNTNLNPNLNPIIHPNLNPSTTTNHYRQTGPTQTMPARARNQDQGEGRPRERSGSRVRDALYRLIKRGDRSRSRSTNRGDEITGRRADDRTRQDGAPPIPPIPDHLVSAGVPSLPTGSNLTRGRLNQNVPAPPPPVTSVPQPTRVPAASYIPSGNRWSMMFEADAVIQGAAAEQVRDPEAGDSDLPTYEPPALNVGPQKVPLDHIPALYQNAKWYLLESGNAGPDQMTAYGRMCLRYVGGQISDDSFVERNSQARSGVDTKMDVGSMEWLFLVSNLRYIRPTHIAECVQFLSQAHDHSDDIFVQKKVLLTEFLYALFVFWPTVGPHLLDMLIQTPMKFKGYGWVTSEIYNIASAGLDCPINTNIKDKMGVLNQVWGR